MMKIAALALATTAALGLGATSRPSLQSSPFAFSAFPDQRADTPWPTREWARAELDKAVDANKLNALTNLLMKPADTSLGKTSSLLIIHQGKIVFERYAPQHSCNTIEHTMSVSKMMGAVIAGVMVSQRRAELDRPLGLKRWSPGDPRTAITLRHALEMSTGLGWEEEGDATFLDFAFGEGYRDLVGYVTKQPLRHRPGAYFQYSDGTSSLVGALALQRVGSSRTAIANWVQSSILAPTGMTRTELEFDKKGAWYGSSGVRWSPCDLGRFGTLLLRGGEWDGQAILPKDWVNQMRTPSMASMKQPLIVSDTSDQAIYYGLQTFIWDLQPRTFDNRDRAVVPIDAFGHYGFGGSALRIVPSRDVVLVAVGVGANDEKATAQRIEIYRMMTDLFPELASASTSNIAAD
ncbi:MAG: beta-lactamase family protein [Sphingopyxis sp.]|nr:beta-lactamase family protein [Sphingopyxis sp.]